MTRLPVADRGVAFLSGFACMLGIIPASESLAQQDFATAVLAYLPAPGQYVNNPVFNDPGRALGPPRGGGTTSPDNSKLVTLGGFGGTLVLAFDHRVLDDPSNPFGLDAIVFGNATYVGANPNRRWAEPATIEISADVNGNGVPDDPWYLIAGSHLNGVQVLHVQSWDGDMTDSTYPPRYQAWVPAGAPSGVWQSTAFELPSPPFGTSNVLANPLGASSQTEGVRGVADHTPTLLLGDLDADGSAEHPDMPPAEFYTMPDDPTVVGITPRSGGGDAFDIAWAIDPASGTSAGLTGFDFIRLTTAVNRVDLLLGEVSAEIGGAADVRPVNWADWNRDGSVDSQDFFVFMDDFFGGDADFNHADGTDAQDYFDFLEVLLGGSSRGGAP